MNMLREQQETPGHDEHAPAENHAQITSDIVSERQGIQFTKIQNEKSRYR